MSNRVHPTYFKLWSIYTKTYYKISQTNLRFNFGNKNIFLQEDRDSCWTASCGPFYFGTTGFYGLFLSLYDALLFDLLCWNLHLLLAFIWYTLTLLICLHLFTWLFYFYCTLTLLLHISHSKLVNFSNVPASGNWIFSIHLYISSASVYLEKLGLLINKCFTSCWR